MRFSTEEGTYLVHGVSAENLENVIQVAFSLHVPVALRRKKDWIVILPKGSDKKLLTPVIHLTNERLKVTRSKTTVWYKLKTARRRLQQCNQGTDILLLGSKDLYERLAS